MMFSPFTLRNTDPHPEHAPLVARIVQYGGAQEESAFDAEALQLVELRYEQYRAYRAMQDAFATGDCTGLSA